MNSNALVLSGGSVKGSFQAGAIQAVLDAGFIPDIIYGVSVGSLNGFFLAHKAAEKVISKSGQSLNEDDWAAIGQELVDFWMSHIKEPDDVAIQRSLISDVLHILRNKFNGLSDIAPIHRILDSMYNENVLRQSPVKLVVGSVDFVSSEMLYKNPFDFDFLDYLKGSMAIPIAMPSQHTRHEEILFDGGVRDVAPLGFAINEGATKIIGILCQSQKLKKESDTFNENKLMQLLDRLESIVVNQNVINDSEWITFINKVVNEAKKMNVNLSTLKEYKIIDHLIIQPSEELEIDITNFTSKEIEANLKLGYKVAKELLENATVIPKPPIPFRPIT